MEKWLKADPEKEHGYLWCGKPTVSVTDILGAVGVRGPDGQWHSLGGYEDYDRYVRGSGDSAKAIGRELHKLASFWVHGADAVYDPILEPWAKHLRQFIRSEIELHIQEYPMLYKLTEEPMYNRRLAYAQTPDLVLFTTKLINQNLKNYPSSNRVRHVHVLDWKFTSVPAWNDAWWLQTAAYALTVKINYKLQAWPTTHIVNISPDGVRHKAHISVHVQTDANRFISALNVYRVMHSDDTINTATEPEREEPHAAAE